MKINKVAPVQFWAIAYLFIGFLGCQRLPDQAQQGSRQRKPIPVKTVAVSETTIERTTVQPATVRAFYEVEIRPKVTGYVDQVKADIGDFVATGAVLASIDVPEMEKQKFVLLARIARYESVEKQTQAGIELAKADVVSAEAKLAQAKSELSRDDASLAASEAEFARTQDLVNLQSVESRLLDEARKRRDSELANRQATLSAITSAQAEVSVANAKQSAAEADRVTAEAETLIAQRQLEELKVMIDYTTLKAPFDGVITKRTVDPGTLVNADDASASAEPLFVLSKIDRVRVHVPVPESDAVSVNKGDEITLSFPFFDHEKPLTVEVTRISNSLDTSTRTMLVEAEIENTDGKLLPGMFGQASIHTHSLVAAKMLPARAIRFEDSGKAYVYALDESDTVTIVDISTGFDEGGRIEIESGLETNQRVIDTHLRRFTTGEKVTVLPN